MRIPDGYFYEDRSVPLTELPRWLFGLMLGLFGGSLLLYGLLGGPFAYPGTARTALVWIIGLTVGHELTHAIFWKGASGLPWRTFRFGFAWKALSPYCHADAPMPARAYRIGSLAPLVLTGFVPLALAVAWADTGIALAAAVLVSGASGDLFVFWSIRDLPDHALVQDHDSQAGCIVLWPEQ